MPIRNCPRCAAVMDDLRECLRCGYKLRGRKPGQTSKKLEKKPSLETKKKIEPSESCDTCRQKRVMIKELEANEFAEVADRIESHCRQCKRQTLGDQWERDA